MFPHFVNRYDMRMVQLRHRLRLIAESSPVFLAGESPRPDQLQGHDTIEAALAGLKNNTHASLADRANQLVVAEIAHARSGGRRLGKIFFAVSYLVW